MKTKARFSLHGLLLIILGLSLSLRQPFLAHAQNDTPLITLTLLVRDGAGLPLERVQLDILIAGPPDEPYSRCATDSLGQCKLALPPGAYLIQFTASWRDRSFVPTSRQNQNPLTDAGLSGFGIYLEPASAEAIVTFVIGEQGNQLIPLWDMSRDPKAPPQPLLPEDGSDIKLGSLQTQPNLSATAQVDFDEIPLPAPLASSIPTWQAGTSSTPPSPTPSSSKIPLPCLSLGIALTLIAVPLLVIALRRRRSNSR